MSDQTRGADLRTSAESPESCLVPHRPRGMSMRARRDKLPAWGPSSDPTPYSSTTLSGSPSRRVLGPRPIFYIYIQSPPPPSPWPSKSLETNTCRVCCANGFCPSLGQGSPRRGLRSRHILDGRAQQHHPRHELTPRYPRFLRLTRTMLPPHHPHESRHSSLQNPSPSS